MGLRRLNPSRPDRISELSLVGLSLSRLRLKANTPYTSFVRSTQQAEHLLCLGNHDLSYLGDSSPRKEVSLLEGVFCFWETILLIYTNASVSEA